MNREDVQQALARMNEAITSLNARLHPPPDDPNGAAELETELASAEQSRATLEQLLNNLPESAPLPAFVAQIQEVMAMRASQTKAHNAAAIRLSKTARKHANDLKELIGGRKLGAEPLNEPKHAGGVKTTTAR